MVCMSFGLGTPRKILQLGFWGSQEDAHCIPHEPINRHGSLSRSITSIYVSAASTTPSFLLSSQLFIMFSVHARANRCKMWSSHLVSCTPFQSNCCNLPSKWHVSCPA